jgi:hypothetical protein
VPNQLNLINEIEALEIVPLELVPGLTIDCTENRRL